MIPHLPETSYYTGTFISLLDLLDFEMCILSVFRHN